jgi:hypothetical protein
MSRTLAAFSSLLAVGVVAGCGGGHGGDLAAASVRSHGASTTATARPVSSAAKPQASLPITKAQAVVFAYAVNLTAADIPEATAVPGDSEGDQRRREQRELTRCVGVEAARHEHDIAQVDSPRLRRGRGLAREEMISTIAVLSNPRSAVKEIASLHTARGRACVVRVIRSQPAGKNTGWVRSARIVVSSLPAHARGAEASVGFRVEATLPLRRTRAPIPYYQDEYTFVLGPAAITLQTASFIQPVADVTEQQLLSLLLGRARAHVL